MIDWLTQATMWYAHTRLGGCLFLLMSEVRDFAEFLRARDINFDISFGLVVFACTGALLIVAATCLLVLFMTLRMWGAA
jgi:hypothetical protein